MTEPTTPNKPEQIAVTATTNPATTAVTGSTGQSEVRDTRPVESDDPEWLNKRLDKAKQSAVNSLLKDLGFNSPDDLKAMIADANKRREADMTDNQKLQSALDAAAKKVLEAEQRANQLESERHSERIDTALRDAAKGAQYPADVVTYARSNFAERLEGALDKSGAVDVKVVEKIVSDIRAARPTWFTSGTPGSPSNAQGQAPQVTSDDQRNAIGWLRGRF